MRSTTSQLGKFTKKIEVEIDTRRNTTSVGINFTLRIAFLNYFKDVMKHKNKKYLRCRIRRFKQQKLIRQKRFIIDFRVYRQDKIVCLRTSSLYEICGIQNINVMNLYRRLSARNRENIEKSCRC